MSKTAEHEFEDSDDLVWGARAIGAVINRTQGQTYHLFETGALDGAVGKLGPKTMVGSRRKLRKFAVSQKHMRFTRPAMPRAGRARPAALLRRTARPVRRPSRFRRPR